MWEESQGERGAAHFGKNCGLAYRVCCTLPCKTLLSHQILQTTKQKHCCNCIAVIIEIFLYHARCFINVLARLLVITEGEFTEEIVLCEGLSWQPFCFTSIPIAKLKTFYKLRNSSISVEDLPCANDWMFMCCCVRLWCWRSWTWMPGLSRHLSQGLVSHLDNLNSIASLQVSTIWNQCTWKPTQQGQHEVLLG